MSKGCYFLREFFELGLQLFVGPLQLEDCVYFGSAFEQFLSYSHHVLNRRIVFILTNSYFISYSFWEAR